MFPLTRRLFGTCPDLDTCQLRPCLFDHTPTANEHPPSLPTTTATTTTTTTTTKSTTQLPLKSALKKRPHPTEETERELGSKHPKTILTTTTTSTRPKAATSTSNSSQANAVASTSRSTLAPSKKPQQTTPSIPVGTIPPRLSCSSAVVADQRLTVPSLALPHFVGQATSTGAPPRITPSPGIPHTPVPTRQKLLHTLFEQFLLNYQSLPSADLAASLASKHAKEQEQTLYSKSTKLTYRNAVISALARLKKRPSPASEAETGTLEDDLARLKKREDEYRGRLTTDRVQKLIHDVETLRKFDYVVEVPEGPGGDRPTEEGKLRTCDRCGKEFKVSPELTEAERTACSYHFGKMITEKHRGIKQRVWSCCPTVGAVTCSQGPHVFRDSAIDVLHSRVGFLETSSFESTTRSCPALDIVALDCEMVYTTSGMSLARLTVIDATGTIILDEHVRPQGAILDLNTRFSGVQEGDIEIASLDVVGVRTALGILIDRETVVVGHGLENDLKALRCVHKKVVDTAILFPHPNGGTWRHSLRNLTKDILGKFIQDSDPALGHSSVDDSKAALELVRWKVKEQARLGN